MGIGERERSLEEQWLPWLHGKVSEQKKPNKMLFNYLKVIYSKSENGEKRSEELDQFLKSFLRWW